MENHYGFKSIIYNAVDCTDQDNYHSKYGRDYWMKDIDQYDMLCKVRRPDKPGGNRTVTPIFFNLTVIFHF